MARHDDDHGVTTWEGTVSPMDLLASGIPLTLLLDLVLGPQSADLLEHERPAPQPLRTAAS